MQKILIALVSAAVVLDAASALRLRNRMVNPLRVLDRAQVNLNGQISKVFAQSRNGTAPPPAPEAPAKNETGNATCPDYVAAAFQYFGKEHVDVDTLANMNGNKEIAELLIRMVDEDHSGTLELPEWCLFYSLQ
jgi:hypothetical protein